MAKLYVVPTPVGNLEDMTFRAISVLREVDCILAEDTRTSGILLKHFDIHTRMQSHHKFNEHQTIEGIVSRIEGGENIALISDAGTPAISDPGFLLVRECRRRDVTVECLPGATAFVPALVASGLPNEKFCFEGFLPQKRGRATRLAELAEEPTPNRPEMPAPKADQKLILQTQRNPETKLPAVLVFLQLLPV